MLDWLVEGGTVVDGSGGAPFRADVGIAGGEIVEIGRITGAARERIDAGGAWVTPASSTSTPTTTARPPGTRPSRRASITARPRW
jgi:N-acyl-D-aspartate/D-glutamate deacylase